MLVLPWWWFIPVLVLLYVFYRWFRRNIKK